jgi:hypothetical protein
MEALAAACGLHGLGWLAGGYYIQGVGRLLAGWALLLVIILVLAAALSLSPPNVLALTLFGIAGMVWVVAASVSALALRKRLENAGPPPYRG